MNLALKSVNKGLCTNSKGFRKKKVCGQRMGKDGDLWDDSALINAFDNAISSYKVLPFFSSLHLFLLNQIPFQFNLISPLFLFQQKMHNTAKNKQESEQIIQENVEISTTSRYNPI